MRLNEIVSSRPRESFFWWQLEDNKSYDVKSCTFNSWPSDHGSFDRSGISKFGTIKRGDSNVAAFQNDDIIHEAFQICDVAGIASEYHFSNMFLERGFLAQSDINKPQYLRFSQSRCSLIWLTSMTNSYPGGRVIYWKWNYWIIL
jgi:hypothetical protein